jgi:hypothetical protein
VVPEGTTDAEGDGGGNGDGDGGCSCQYMGSSSCSNSSASNPCWLRAVAARASAKNSALALNGRRGGALEGLGRLDKGWARGSSEAGTDTNAPKSESVELAALIEPRRGRGLGGCENMDEDAGDGMGEAGGVAGEKRVAKRSSRPALDGGMGEPLGAGTGIRGEMESSGEGILRI